MKKLLALIIPVLFIMYSCDNKPAAETVEVTQDTVVTIDTVATLLPEDSVGAPIMPAEVFEELTAKPVSGAKVIITNSGRTVEEAITDANGKYVTTKLVAGRTYTYTFSKTGYATKAETKVYQNAESLPGFAVTK